MISSQINRLKYDYSIYNRKFSIFQRAIYIVISSVGFIGLVIPHILRLCGLTDHRVLLPGCALAGASALLLADIVARLALAAAELPIGVVTATLGAPVFIWLLLKARR